jgi:hypothetical protein
VESIYHDRATKLTVKVDVEKPLYFPTLDLYGLRLEGRYRRRSNCLEKTPLEYRASKFDIERQGVELP